MHLSLAIALLALTAIFSAHSQRVCDLQNCGGFNYLEIPKYYRGLFKTRLEIIRQDGQWARFHQRRFGNNLASFFAAILHPLYRTFHDFDQCCPTQLTHINPTTLLNSNGISRVILHLDQLNPPQYQWIPNAVCSSAPHYCTGICRIETITLYLLVVDLNSNPPFEFDAFNIPAYCSCKSS